MEQIGSALGRILKEAGLLEGIRRQQILRAWSEIVGPEFAAKSRPVRISQDVLWVEAEGSSWAAQIMMIRHEVMKRFRAKFGDLPFHDIRVAAGMIRRGANGAGRPPEEGGAPQTGSR